MASGASRGTQNMLFPGPALVFKPSMLPGVWQTLDEGNSNQQEHIPAAYAHVPSSWFRDV